MKSFKSPHALSLIVLAFVSTSALADGYYVSGSAGQSRVAFSNTGVIDGTDNMTAGKLALGYTFAPGFAVEVGYANHGSKSWPALASLSVKGQSLFGDLVATSALTSKVSFVGRLGVANTRITANSVSGSSRDSSTKVHFGFGGQYDFSKSIGLRAEWERFQSEGGFGEAKATLATVGVIYNF